MDKTRFTITEHIAHRIAQMPTAMQVRGMSEHSEDEMLVLSRKPTESLTVNDNVVVTVLEVRGNKVRLGIDAPKDVSVHRTEVYAMLSEFSVRAGPSTGEGDSS